MWDGRIESVRFLLDAGADPNRVAADGATALSMAKKGRHADVLVPMLETAGARDVRKAILKGLKTKLKKDKRSAFGWVTTPGEPASILDDRFGGQPFLTAEYPRPHGGDDQPLALMVQLDLSRHPYARARQAGLLQVFHDPTTHPYAQARWVPEPQLALERPADGPALRAQTITGYGRSKADFPGPEDPLRSPVSLSEAEEALLPYLNLGGDKLGGWPDWVQSPNYPERHNVLLVQLVDGGVTGVALGDAASLYVLQNPTDPADIRVVLQSY